MTKTAAHGGWQEIFAGRHSISLNLFLILPLLIVYEIGIRVSKLDLRNAAEVILKDFYWLMGADYVRYFHWILALIIIFCFLRTASVERPFVTIFFAILLESLLLAMLLGPLLSYLIGGFLLQYDLTSVTAFSSSVLLSVGAGVYEEIVFRFLLLGGLFALCRHAFQFPFWLAATIALLVSSVLFSVYHHIGPFAQAITAPVFVFRFVAGMALGLVFMFRGFGVAVYLHAFYDILRDIESALRGGS